MTAPLPTGLPILVYRGFSGLTKALKSLESGMSLAVDVLHGDEHSKMESLPMNQSIAGRRYLDA